MKKIFNYGWGGGYTDLLLSLESKTPQLFDVEFDRDYLHQKYGGRTTYTTRSGLRGEGFLQEIGSLIPVGTWRIDTKWNDEFQNFVSIGAPQWMPEIMVAIPCISHQENKEQTLQNYPVVIKVGTKVIYCNFYTNFTETLKAILLGKDLPEYEGRRKTKKTFQKTFTFVYRNEEGDKWEEEEKFEIDFYNLFQSSNKETPNPWSFFRDELIRYKVPYKQPRIFELLGVEKLEDNKFIRTINIDGSKYRGGLLEGDPLETGELTAGWQRVSGDVLIRFYENEAHLLAYTSAKEACAKKAQRLAQKMGEGEEFIKFLESAHQGEYEEFELLVPKALYMLDNTNLIARLRKDLADKIDEKVRETMWSLVGQVTDEDVLEAIPDDLVISVDDYRRINNCFPDIENLVNEYFSESGQAETTAKELKKYAADNCDVMRVFRYLAVEGRFKLNLPLKA